jgi:hypothetical protein
MGSALTSAPAASDPMPQQWRDQHRASILDFTRFP